MGREGLSVLILIVLLSGWFVGWQALGAFFESEERHFSSPVILPKAPDHSPLQAPLTEQVPVTIEVPAVALPEEAAPPEGSRSERLVLDRHESAVESGILKRGSSEEASDSKTSLAPSSDEDGIFEILNDESGQSTLPVSEVARLQEDEPPSEATASAAETAPETAESPRASLKAPFRFPLEGEVPDAFVTAGVSTVLETSAYIYFPAGSPALSPSAREALRAVAERTQASDHLTLLATSFLDIRETSRPVLSEQRLDAITDYLKSITGKEIRIKAAIPLLELVEEQERDWQARMRARRIELLIEER